MSDESQEAIENYSATASAEILEALREDPLMAIKSELSENNTLRTHNERLNRNNNFLIVVCIFAIFAAYSGWTRPEKLRYFYIDGDGRAYETSAYGVPPINKKIIERFALEVAEGLHNWSHDKYGRQFAEVFSLCDKAVVSAYYDNHGKKGVFQTAEQYKQTYTSIVTRKELKQERTLKTGMREWRVQLTLDEVITGTAKPTENTYDIVIDIQEVSPEKRFRGLECVRYDENFK